MVNAAAPLPPIKPPLVIVAPVEPQIRSLVLVVEHEAAIRDFLQAVLEEEQLRVVTAVDEPEALWHAAVEDPTLLITNQRIAPTSGEHLAEDLRAHYGASLPVLILSTASHQIIEQARQIGKYDYLAMPFDLDELVAVVGRLLRTQGQRQQH